MTGDVIGRFPDATIVAPGATIGHQEVDHRVANSLQMISSLLTIQARDTADQIVRDALESAVHRINAVAGVHQHLYRSSLAHSIDIAPYLLKLSSKMERCCGTGAVPRQINTHVQSHLVPADFASMLGIVINELVMNACKHAYAPDEPGEIDIVLFFPNRSEFLMEVRDYGGVADVQKIPLGSGMGMRVIDAIGRNLNAVHTHVADDEGTRFVMRGTVSLSSA